MERGAWWAAVHGVAKNETRLSAQAHTQSPNNRLQHLSPSSGSRSAASYPKSSLGSPYTCIHLLLSFSIVKK